MLNCGPRLRTRVREISRAQSRISPKITHEVLRQLGALHILRSRFSVPRMELRLIPPDSCPPESRFQIRCDNFAVGVPLIPAAGLDFVRSSSDAQVAERLEHSIGGTRHWSVIQLWKAFSAEVNNGSSGLMSDLRYAICRLTPLKCRSALDEAKRLTPDLARPGQTDLELPASKLARVCEPGN